MFFNFFNGDFESRLAEQVGPPCVKYDMTVPPNAVADVRQGAAVAQQYLELITFRRGSFSKYTQYLQAIYDKAKQLAENSGEAVDSERPSMQHVMQAVVDLGLAYSSTKVRWRDTVEGMKIDMFRYGGAMAEFYMVPGMTA